MESKLLFWILVIYVFSVNEVNCGSARVYRSFISRNRRDRMISRDPCINYQTINQPQRRTAYVINNQTSTALCDRIMNRRWYRFTGGTGDKMPERCVKENHCGTHYPIWLNGEHPSMSGRMTDVEVCVSKGDHCCYLRWYIRVMNCGDFYTYRLHDTPSCYMSYCAGTQLPCPPGLSSPTGFAPGCTEHFPSLDGESILEIGSTGSEIVFNCDFHGAIPPHTKLQATWYEVDSDSQYGDNPIYIDDSVASRRSVMPESKWYSRMGSKVQCSFRAKWTNGNGVPSEHIFSRALFTGLVIRDRILNVSESAGDSFMEIQSTMPVTCLYGQDCDVKVQFAHSMSGGEKICIEGEMEQIVFGDCSISLTPTNWRNLHRVPIKAVRDFYRDGNKRMLIGFKPIFTDNASPVWNSYKPPDVEVLTSDVATRMCESTGDPHLTSFDGVYFHVYLEGEFVLYRNTRLPIQVNTRLEICGQRVTCNCGVAVKVGDDVIVIDRCKRKRRNMAFGRNFPEGWRTLHRHALEQGGGFTRGMKIIEYDGGHRYTVHLPTGGYLDFQIGEKWVNIFLYVSSDDYRSTEGLCGTFDKDMKNDFQLRNKTHIPVLEHGACGEDTPVCQFAESWRVKPEDSFFGREVNADLMGHTFAEDKHYCKCKREVHGRSTILCNYNYDVDNCQAERLRRTGEDKTDNLILKHRAKRNAEYVDHNLDDYFDTEFQYNEAFRGTEPRWPTHTGITERQARDHCKRTVERSVAGRVCSRKIRREFPRLIQSCVIDIKVTGEYTLGETIMDSVTAECETAIHDDASLWRKPETTTQPGDDTSRANEMLKNICRKDCSRKGRCIKGRCECMPGYTGAECAEKIHQIPKLAYVTGGGVCDLAVRPCRHVMLYGSGLLNSSLLTCHIEFKSQSRLIWAKSVPAIFETFEEVTCPLIGQLNDNETSAYGEYHIMVSNDGQRKSNKMSVVVHNMECTECRLENDEMICQRKNNTCMHEGTCFKEGDAHEDDCCILCQPELSIDKLTSRLNLEPPRFLTSQTTHILKPSDDLDLDIVAHDSSECDIKYDIKAIESNLFPFSETTMTERVQIQLHRPASGEHMFSIKARNKCGAEKTLHFKIVVLKVKTEKYIDPSSDCIENLPPKLQFANANQQISVKAGKTKKQLMQAIDPESDDVTFSVHKLYETDSVVTISSDGMLSYKGLKPMTEEVVVIATDRCGHQTSSKVTFMTT